MRLQVVPRCVLARLRPFQRYAVISITDPFPDGSEAHIPRRPNLAGVLRVEFHDFDRDVAVINGDKLYMGRPYRDWCMRPDHGSQVARFVEAHQLLGTDIMVVHCEAGASRSPSVAMAIADSLKIERGGIEWVEGANSPPPNRHVYDTTSRGFHHSDPAGVA